MPTPITNGLPKDLTAQEDVFFDAEALKNAGVSTSSEFVLGNTSGGVELKIVANTAHTVTASIAVSVQTATAEGGTYAEVQAFTIPTGAVAVGDDLVKYILPKEETGKIWTKVVITTTTDESALKVDGYIVKVA